jgi:hypothetical protein
VFDFIEIYYNHSRDHQDLDYCLPAQ